MADLAEWLVAGSSNPAWDCIKLLALTAGRRARGWEARTANHLERDGFVFTHETKMLARWLRESDWEVLARVVEADNDVLLDEMGVKVFAQPRALGDVARQQQRDRARRLAGALWSHIVDVADRDTLGKLQGAASDTRVRALLDRVTARLDAVEANVHGLESHLKLIEGDIALKRWRTPLPSTFLGSPGVLLSARHRVIPYIGREEKLKDLTQWLATAAPLAMRFVSGRGGSGKTSLAGEVCRMAGRHGWTTGILADSASTTQIDRLVSSRAARLIVVDYAETRSDLADLIERLDAVADIHCPCRILVLERQHRELSGPDEVRRIRDEAGEPISLDEDLLSLREREQLFDAAVTASARLLQTTPSTFRPDLSSETFDRVLMVAAVAVIAALGSTLRATELVDEAVFARLVEHETNYWSKTSKRRVIPVRDELWSSAVTVGAVFGWSEPDATQARSREHELGDLLAATKVCVASEAHSVASWLLELYPGGRLPLDPMADYLIGNNLTDNILAVSFGVDARQTALRSIPTLARVAQSSRSIASQCASYARSSLRDLVAAVKADNGSWAIEPLRLCIALTDYIPRDIRDQLSEHPIHPSLRHAASDVAELAVKHLRNAVGADPTLIPELAKSLNGLGIRYAELGRRTEALPLAEEAVALWRGLCTESDPTAIRELATALNSLANRFGQVARTKEALGSAEESVSLWRELATTDNALQPLLARALNNLSVRYRALENRTDAIRVAEEALTLRRQLAASDPSHVPDVAESLSNIGYLYLEDGRIADALRAAEEAITIRRGVDASNPKYLQWLARSSNNLAILYAQVSRVKEAIPLAEEALGIRRDLAATNSAFIPELAESLNTLAAVYAHVDRHEEARPLAEEALAIQNELAATNPAFVPGASELFTVP